MIIINVCYSTRLSGGGCKRTGEAASSDGRQGKRFNGSFTLQPVGQHSLYRRVHGSLKGDEFIIRMFI